MLPKILKNFNVFIEGQGYAGRVSEMTLPKLSRKMEEYRAGGMNAPVEIDMGMEKLEMEFTLQEFTREILSQWGVTDVSGVSLRFAGSAVSDDPESNDDIIEIVVRGRWREIDMGTQKLGDMSVMKVSVASSYFKYSVNGDDIIEIDSINMIEKVNGVDRLSQQRKALGL